MKKITVGQVVRAIDDTGRYTLTTKNKKWVGKVIKVSGDTFDAATMSCTYGSEVGKEYYGLEQKYFELVKKELEDIEMGDIVIDSDGDEGFVMGVAGKMVWLSDTDEEADSDADTTCYTISELKEDGYIVKNGEAEVRELSIDEIAEKFGMSAEEIRIKKE